MESRTPRKGVPIWRLIISFSIAITERNLQSPTSHRKAVEHHRTPKRKRNYRVRNGGHVLECGRVLPPFERAPLSICLLGWRFCHSSGYVNAPESAPKSSPIRFLFQKCFFAVDATVSTAILLIPPEAGPDTCWGGSRLFWDCKLDSILSRHDKRSPPWSRSRGKKRVSWRSSPVIKLSFFVA
jgi:hypothetical protein